jgi:hypothetical protein
MKWAIRPPRIIDCLAQHALINDGLRVPVGTQGKERLKELEANVDARRSLNSHKLYL